MRVSITERLGACCLVMAAYAGWPALAITDGFPDGDLHPNVGAIVYRPVLEGGEPGPLRKFCSGTLISPSVFLTAGHCTIRLQERIAAGQIVDDAVWVTFAPAFVPDGDLAPIVSVQEIATHPDYSAGSDDSTPTMLADDRDVGVLILDPPPVGLEPAQLPPAGLIGDLAQRGGLHGQTFVAVGYGQDVILGGGLPQQPDDGLRKYAFSEYRALAVGYLFLSMNAATGDGGTCRGDSGGPNFLGESEIIAAITSWGDPPCQSLNAVYRLDTESARSFLAGYVTLP